MMPVHARALAITLAALWAGTAFEPALAQSRNDYGIRDIMVEEPGRRPAKGNKIQSSTLPKQRGEPKQRPRGSSYVPETGLPRSQPVQVAPATPGVYTPPPINSYGDRVIGCNHSFPLNAGIGNNPTDRSSYVRQCAN
jgi:hypothetical protein